MFDSGIALRPYFSIQHIISASLFCRKSYQIEKDYDGIFNENVIFEHNAYVINSIISSVSFLEATINELFCDSVDSTNNISALGNVKIKLLADNWKSGVPRTSSYSVTDKYQRTLEIFDMQLFDKGKSPYQEVIILTKLRNALIHYEPEWYSCQINQCSINEELNKLARQLLGKFDVSEIYKNTGNSFFPDKCLGHGCAEWAINSSIKFADEFFGKIGMKPTFDHIRPLLNTK